MRILTVAVLTVVLVLSLAAVGLGEQAQQNNCLKSYGPCPPGKEIKIWGGLSSKPKTSDNYEPTKANIGIGSFDMFEIQGPAAGYSLAEREVAIYNRLTEILSKGPVRPESVCVGKVRSAPTIYVGNYRLVSVYAKDAAAAGMTQQQLAEKWAAGIAAALPKVVTAAAAPRPDTPPYEVAIGGQLFFRLRDNDGYPTLLKRGEAVERQLTNVLSDGRQGRLQAKAVQQGNEWVVLYGEQRVVTATSCDAAFNAGTSPEKLANMWADNLNAAMAKLKSNTDVSATPAVCN